MNVIKEEWKPIEGFEGLYEISNLGRVKSLWFGREKIMNLFKSNGYLRVNLWRNGKMKKLYVHRLVSSAFIPNPEGFEQVNHKDENPSNNVVTNLEWCSAKYNNNYGSHNEKVAAARINHPSLSKSVEASKFSDFRTIELRFASTADAGRNGYGCGAVSKCCRGCFNREGNNKYKNLYWRYAS